jgi:flagellar motor switch protein FliG
VAELGPGWNAEAAVTAQMSGLRKAAILLVAVGEELAKEILRALPEVDVQRITEELADLRGSPRSFQPRSGRVLGAARDAACDDARGLDYATRLLQETFGKQRADDLLMLVRRAQEASQGNLGKLQKTDPQQLGKLLDSEHPQTIALVLAHLDPRRASQVLDNLSEEHKVVSISGWRRCGSFLRRWRRRWRTFCIGAWRAWATPSARATPASRRWPICSTGSTPKKPRSILETIEDGQPELALNIRNLMFTFEDLVTVPPARSARLSPAWTSGSWRWPCAAPMRAARAVFKRHEFARCRDAEGRHGSDGPGALPRSGRRRSRRF